MKWRFTIIDRNNVSTVIKQPVNWDANTITIKRDPLLHGVFMDIGGTALEFYRNGGRLLKAENDQYGAAGIMYLLAEFNCSGTFEALPKCQFIFSKFEWYCDGCYAKVPATTIGEVVDLRNRIDQPVNLETLLGFDETTELPGYDKLPFDLTLPSKGIFLQDNAGTVQDSVESFESGLQPPVTPGTIPTNLTLSQIEFGLKDNLISEIGSFSVFSTHQQNYVSQNGAANFMILDGSGIIPLYCNPVLNYYEGSLNYGDISEIVPWDIRLKGKISVLESYIGNVNIFLLRLRDRPGYLANGDIHGSFPPPTDYDILASFAVNAVGCGNYTCMNPPNSGDILFDFIFQQDVPLFKGDRYYLFMPIAERKSAANITAVNAGAKAFSIDLDPVSHISISDISHTPDTIAKAYMINEALSRVTEAITNDRLRVYSDYFGRTDSHPYQADADGCGALECITNGLRIRRAEDQVPDKPSLYSISLQDIFTGIRPIHNVGMGIEVDNHRANHNLLRVEPWYYFYNDTVIMTCNNVAKIVKKTQEKQIYSTFKFGYGKWEAEQYNGLDEFLTKRIYRTTLDSIKNELQVYSTMVASGYALEITRRIKSDIDTKDWKYDNESFIICLTRVQTFHVFFDADTNSMSFDYLGDSAPFLAALTIDIAGTVANDSTRTIFSIVISNGTHYVIKFTGGATVNEESHTVTFPSLGLDPGLFVELGNVESSENIIDPATIYNFRITPVRNAMRWIDTVFASYKQFDDNNKIIFTDGDANYYAKGKMIDSTCRLENQPIAENITIDRTIFEDQDNAKPILSPERVTFDFPMSVNQYHHIKNKPTGRIAYNGGESGCESGYGYIDTITYKPNDGMANFSLIPQIL